MQSLNLASLPLWLPLIHPVFKACPGSKQRSANAFQYHRESEDMRPEVSKVKMLQLIATSVFRIEGGSRSGQAHLQAALD